MRYLSAGLMFELQIEDRACREFARGMGTMAEKQLPFALSKALNDTVAQGWAEVIASLDKRFNRPTPFTKLGITFGKANERDLSETIYVRPIQGKNLALTEIGGTRTPRRRAVIKPKGVKLKPIRQPAAAQGSNPVAAHGHIRRPDHQPQEEQDRGRHLATPKARPPQGRHHGQHGQAPIAGPLRRRRYG